jgi:hypothetical protein
MERWLLLGIALAAAPVGCSSSKATSDAGADATTDTGACACTLGGVNVACGQAVCSGGTQYLCSSGAPIAIGPCDMVQDAGTMEGGGCIPQCSTRTCGMADMCGGTCSCPSGIPCNGGICGNGCSLNGGDPGCLPDSGEANLCCSYGAVCVVGDAGFNTCCAQTGQPAPCLMDTDCCDYPTAHCSGTTHTCQ